jgi:hypothetical protein
MALHLIKLCVGVSTLEELLEWRNEYIAQQKQKKRPLVIEHITRQMPKRRDEILNGGSLYWVIAGQIACRTPIIDLAPCVKNDLPHCRIVMAPQTVRVLPRPMRPFQGWRYLAAKDAPQDVDNKSLIDGKNWPMQLLVELNQIGVK